MKPAVLVRRGGELPLSGRSLTGLLIAVLAKGRPFRFRARGASMSPLIKDGDVVTIAPPGGAGPRPGEIVAFVHPATGNIAVHRLVRRAGGRFAARGDNADVEDGTLPSDRILGVVTSVERGGRKVGPSGRRSGPALAFLSRTGWLDRGLALVRRLAGRTPNRTP